MNKFKEPSLSYLTLAEEIIISEIITSHPTRTTLVNDVKSYKSKQSNPQITDKELSELRMDLVHKYSLKSSILPPNYNYKKISELWKGCYVKSLSGEKDIAEIYKSREWFIEWIQTVDLYKNDSYDTIIVVYKTKDNMRYLVDKSGKKILQIEWNIGGTLMADEAGNIVGSQRIIDDKEVYILDKTNQVIWSKYIEESASCYKDPCSDNIIIIRYSDRESITHILYRDYQGIYHDVLSVLPTIGYTSWIDIETYGPAAILPTVNFYTDENNILIFKFHKADSVYYYTDSRIITKLLWNWGIRKDEQSKKELVNILK